MSPDDHPKLDPRTDIGHVHLKVADLERAVAFYRDELGFDVTARLGGQAAFLSAGGYHHHIGLNTWESRGGAPPPGAPASRTEADRTAAGARLSVARRAAGRRSPDAPPASRGCR